MFLCCCEMCVSDCMKEFPAQIFERLVCFLFPGPENAGLSLALRVLVLPEVLAKVAHQASYRAM